MPAHHDVHLGMATLQLPHLDPEQLTEFLESMDDVDSIAARTVEHAVLAEQSGVSSYAMCSLFGVAFGHAHSLSMLREVATRTSHIRLVCVAPNLVSSSPTEIFALFAELNRDFPDRFEITLGRDAFGELTPHSCTETANTAFDQYLSEWGSLAGGSPEPPRAWIDVHNRSSAVMQAVQHRIPLQFQIRSGCPSDCKPFADIYHQANHRFARGTLPLAFQLPGFVAATDTEARDAAYEFWRLRSPRSTPEAERRSDFDREATSGAAIVGSPDTVARRLADAIELLGASRASLRYPSGMFNAPAVHDCVCLYGEEVIPRVQRLLKKAS